jgi:hypothetical protein
LIEAPQETSVRFGFFSALPSNIVLDAEARKASLDLPDMGSIRARLYAANLINIEGNPAFGVERLWKLTEYGRQQFAIFQYGSR